MRGGSLGRCAMGGRGEEMDMRVGRVIRRGDNATVEEDGVRHRKDKADVLLDNITHRHTALSIHRQHLPPMPGQPASPPNDCRMINATSTGTRSKQTPQLGSAMKITSHQFTTIHTLSLKLVFLLSAIIASPFVAD